MARKTKQGLDYFPFNVDFFEDDKLQFVSARFGCKGENITIKLLCKIYSNKGYYYSWGEDETLLFAKRAGFEVALVNDVVSELLKRDFFNEVKFRDFKILTSNGIQERFFEAVGRRKLLDVNNDYLINVDIITLNVNINPLNVRISTQSKVKESKVKESKVKNNQEDFNFDFVPDLFCPPFFRFLEYRKKIHKEFKTQMSLEACYKNLIELSKNNPITASEVVEQSIANQWQGLFELKEKNSAKKESYGQQQIIGTKSGQQHPLAHLDTLANGVLQGLNNPDS